MTDETNSLPNGESPADIFAKSKELAKEVEDMLENMLEQKEQREKQARSTELMEFKVERALNEVRKQSLVLLNKGLTEQLKSLENRGASIAPEDHEQLNEERENIKKILAALRIKEIREELVREVIEKEGVLETINERDIKEIVVIIEKIKLKKLEEQQLLEKHKAACDAEVEATKNFNARSRLEELEEKQELILQKKMLLEEDLAGPLEEKERLKKQRRLQNFLNAHKARDAEIEEIVRAFNFQQNSESIGKNSPEAEQNRTQTKPAIEQDSSSGSASLLKMKIRAACINVKSLLSSASDKLVETFSLSSHRGSRRRRSR